MEQFLTPDVLSILGVGLGLALLMLRTLARIDSYRAEASADRCAFQAGMDDFRREMQRLAERQSNLEGRMRPSGGD